MNNTNLITSVKALLLFFAVILAFNFLLIRCDHAIFVGIYIATIFLILDTLTPSYSISFVT